MIKKILLGIILLIAVAALVFFAPGVMSGDLENETRITINRPRDEVWTKFQDESKMGEWLEGFKSIEPIEGPPRTVGSKFKLTFVNDGQEIVMTETMTAYKEGEHFAFNLANDVMYSDIDIKLIDKGPETELIQKEKYHGQNVFWHALFFWMKTSMANHSEQNMVRFKKYAEGA